MATNTTSEDPKRPLLTLIMNYPQRVRVILSIAIGGLTAYFLPLPSQATLATCALVGLGVTRFVRWALPHSGASERNQMTPSTLSSARVALRKNGMWISITASMFVVAMGLGYRTVLPWQIGWVATAGLLYARRPLQVIILAHLKRQERKAAAIDQLGTDSDQTSTPAPPPSSDQPTPLNPGGPQGLGSNPGAAEVTQRFGTTTPAPGQFAVPAATDSRCVPPKATTTVRSV